MPRIKSIAVLVGLVAITSIASDAFARGRYFNPRMARFMQRDPVGTAYEPPMARNVSSRQFTQPDSPTQYGDGMNLYEYVGSNPVTYVDPTGLWHQPQHDEIEDYALDIALERVTDITPKCQRHIRSRLKAANASQDSIGGDLWDHRRHYTRKRGTNAAAEDSAYTNYLDEEIIRFYQHMVRAMVPPPSDREDDCNAALVSLGLRHHSFQDFFSHAIRKDRGGGQVPGQNSKYEGWKAWTASPPVKGTPFFRESFDPSTWPEEHPRWSEPLALGSDEANARLEAAKAFMASKTPKEIRVWIDICRCSCEH